MHLEISKEAVFIPAFKGNRELSAADQITVRYRIPTVAIKNRCRSRQKARGISAPDGKMEHIEISIEKDDNAVLNEMLISISNCTYSEGPGKKTCAVISAQDLLNAPVNFEPLLKEIIEEFNGALDHAEADEKN